MKRKLSFRKKDGDLEILWCGEDVSGESWGTIMKMVLKGKEVEGITLVESRMIEAFPGIAPIVSQKDLDANKVAPAPDMDEGVDDEQN
ncbi:MAG: hypothetical protein ACW98F_20200 [Candidatus Hodarchaeales archaeon]|jgi:hypothetical protein